LLAAARNGHFTIFKILMDSHDTKKGYFEGIRSQHPEGQGTALNYLLRHLIHNDTDNETVFGEEGEGLTSNLVFECVCTYLDSMIKNASWSVNFQSYTSVKDEWGMTPIDYLAQKGDVKMLMKLADYQYSSYK